jgi:hypothetical protein
MEQYRMSTDTIDAEVVTTDLIEQPSNLGALALRSPAEVLEKAAEVATALKQVIVDKHLFVTIREKDYVFCEGWTTLGAMLGVGVKEKATIESPNCNGEFISEVEAVRLVDGVVIGGASASCGPDERDWNGRSRQARRSMAQTRAAGKAMRLLFSWVMNLAGYAVTPWEEIEGQLAPPQHDNPNGKANAPQAKPRGQRVDPKAASEQSERWKRIFGARGNLLTADEWIGWARRITGAADFDPTKASQWTPELLAKVKGALDAEDRHDKR